MIHQTFMINAGSSIPRSPFVLVNGGYTINGRNKIIFTYKAINRFRDQLSVVCLSGVFRPGWFASNDPLHDSFTAKPANFRKLGITTQNGFSF